MKRLVLAITGAACVLAATAALAGAGTSIAPQLVKIKSPVTRGGHAHIVAHANAANICRITVYSKSGRVHSRRLTPEDPGTDYRLAWEWLMPTNARLGAWHVRISCGSAGSLQTTFRVIRA